MNLMARLGLTMAAVEEIEGDSHNIAEALNDVQ